MDLSKLKPVPKIQAVAYAGGATTVILLLASLLGLQLPEDKVNELVVGVSALVSLVTFVAGWWKKGRK